jgi:hypothetical protein
MVLSHKRFTNYDFDFYGCLHFVLLVLKSTTYYIIQHYSGYQITFVNNYTVYSGYQITFSNNYTVYSGYQITFVNDYTVYSGYQIK